MGVRRSGRIAKELPILLIGTDATGKVFSEQTTTVVLSRHGAGIVSQHTFTPEDVLTVRLVDTSRDADVRLVGRMGETDRGHIYGVEFLDPGVNYWGLEFPPPEQYPALPDIWLECVLCHGSQKIQPTEIEADVFLTAETILRPCRHCGHTTPWRKPSDVPPLARLPAKAADASPSPAASHTEQHSPPAPGVAAVPAATTAVLEAVPLGAMPAPGPGPPGTPAVAGKAVATGSPTSVGKRRENRRKHVRTKVSFTACIRYRCLEEEVVECENVSKGGLCFRSFKRYPEDAQIEVAAPFELGAPAIFVPAEIRHIEKLPDAAMYRYGVAYLHRGA